MCAKHLLFHCPDYGETLKVLSRNRGIQNGTQTVWGGGLATNLSYWCVLATISHWVANSKADERS